MSGFVSRKYDAIIMMVHHFEFHEGNIVQQHNPGTVIHCIRYFLKALSHLA